MNKLSIYLTGILSLILLFGCENEEGDLDDVKPQADFIFPLSCDTVTLGETFNVAAKLSDNIELGSFSINIHHNFDQHGHSTEPEPCDLDAKKDPVDDFGYQESFQIDPGLTDYTTNVPITIPSEKDHGDYHLTVTVVDKSGWSSFRIISIKVIE